MYKFSFEKLEVWQISRSLAIMVYDLTTIFPSSEKFGLTSQIRRSAISVASNVAEGAGRTSSKDQAHFTQLAYGSLMELLNQLIISSDVGYIKISDVGTLRNKIEIIANQLNALRKAQLNRYQK